MVLPLNILYFYKLKTYNIVTIGSHIYYNITV